MIFVEWLRRMLEYGMYGMLCWTIHKYRTVLNSVINVTEIIKN